MNPFIVGIIALGAVWLAAGLVSVLAEVGAVLVTLAVIIIFVQSFKRKHHGAK